MRRKKSSSDIDIVISGIGQLAVAGARWAGSCMPLLPIPKSLCHRRSIVGFCVEVVVWIRLDCSSLSIHEELCKFFVFGGKIIWRAYVGKFHFGSIFTCSELGTVHFILDRFPISDFSLLGCMHACSTLVPTADLDSYHIMLDHRPAMP